MSLDQPQLDTSPQVSDEIRKTTCYMCACRCGINVHMKDGGPIGAKVLQLKGLSSAIRVRFVQDEATAGIGR